MPSPVSAPTRPSGCASDLLIRAGGTSIISETPEFFGAEHLFARRAASREVAKGIFDQIQRYREYAQRNGASLTENPSPGNKEGGLLNITIKSLGAMAKAGQAPVQGVIDYGEPYWQTRFQRALSDARPRLRPGKRPGHGRRWLPVGLLYHRARLGAGQCHRPGDQNRHQQPHVQPHERGHGHQRGHVLDGATSISAVGQQIFAEILAVASGKVTKAEENGHREFTIWSEEGISL